VKIVIPSVARKELNERFIIFLALLLSLSTTAYPQQTVHDIIKIDSCPDITLLEEPELYVGDDLFSLINGGAEVYHEYGFVEVLACKMQTKQGSEVKCEIYDMGSQESAWGIYSFTATSKAIPFNAGTEGRSGQGFSQFIKGRFMVYLHYETLDSDELQYFAGCIAANIENDTPQPELMINVASGAENAQKTLYFLGNLGMSNVYSFHYKDVFGFNEGAAAVYPDKKVLLLNYPDEIQCLEHYNSARDFFMNSSKYHDQRSLRGSFHIKDRKEQQIDCYFENTFLVIFISSGEQDLNQMRKRIVDSMQ